MKKQYTITIYAPIENAFDCLDDKAKIPHLMDGQMKTKFQNYSDPENLEGTKFKNKIPGLIEWEGEVIAYKRPFLLGVGVKLGKLSGTCFYNFKYVSNAVTELTCELEAAEGTKFQQVTVKPLFPVFESVLKKQMDGIKKVAEQNNSSNN